MKRVPSQNTRNGSYSCETDLFEREVAGEDVSWSRPQECVTLPVKQMVQVSTAPTIIFGKQRQRVSKDFNYTIAESQI